MRRAQRVLTWALLAPALAALVYVVGYFACSSGSGTPSASIDRRFAYHWQAVCWDPAGHLDHLVTGRPIALWYRTGPTSFVLLRAYGGITYPAP